MGGGRTQDEAKQPTKPCAHPPLGENAPHTTHCCPGRGGGYIYTPMLGVGKGAPSGARRGGEMAGRGPGPPPAPPARAAPSAQPNITATPPGAVGAPPARAAFQHLLPSPGLPGPCPAPPTGYLPPAQPSPADPRCSRGLGNVVLVGWVAAPRGPGTAYLCMPEMRCWADIGVTSPRLQAYLGSPQLLPAQSQALPTPQ